MGAIKDKFDEVGRDFATDGVRSSGTHNPKKVEFRAIGPIIEQAIAVAGLGAMVDVSYATLAELNADLAYENDSIGLVYADPDSANIDFYRKTGASGTGAWSLTSAIHSILETLAADYANRAEAAALISEDAAVAEVAKLLAEPAPVGFAWAMKDDRGEAALAQREPELGGALVAPGFEGQTAQFKSLFVDGVAMRPDGNTARAGFFAYNVELMPIYGQSLSLGAQATPAITDVQAYDSLMFQGGLLTSHPDNALAFHGGLVDAVGADPLDGSVYGECPVLGAAAMIKERIASEAGLNFADHDYQFLLNAPGEGGVAIEQLDAPSIYYSQLEQAVTEGYNLAQTAGKTFGCRSMFLVHGEQDNADGTTVDTAKTKIENLRLDFQGHVQEVTGSSEPIQIISNQTQRYFAATHGPLWQQAVMELWTENANFHLACPMYHFQYADAVHLDNVSSKWLGAYLGLCRARVVDFGLDWAPLHPIAAKAQGRLLEIRFHVPAGSIEIDTDGVPAVANYGFNLFQPDGVTPIAITSVSRSQPDTIRIEAGAAIPVGGFWTYAIDNGDGGTNACGPTGPRGNIRDSQGDTLIFDPTGIDKPMHNWLPHIVKQIVA